MKRTLLALVASLALTSASLASGLFTGLPAAIGPGQPSIGAPTTGGGPITQGCIPMDTGNAQGIVPASQCVSPSQLAASVSGVQLSYSSARIDPAVPLANTGVDTTPVAGTIYFAQINIPLGFVVTNVACLNGSVGATNNLIYGLYNGSSGALVASTALAGTLAATANVFQAIALTAPYTAAVPSGGYFVAWQTNGAATRLRTIGANGAGDLTGSQAGAFGTLASITPPTVFTPNVGPICYVN